MNRMKFYLVIFLIITPLAFITAPPVSAAEGNEAFEKDDDGYYRVRIEASQWEFKAFDLVHAEEIGFDFEDATETEKTAIEVKHRVVMEEAKAGDKIEFQLYSRDVQHGFSINELDLQVALNRPSPGDEFGAPITIEVELDAPELADDAEGSPGDGVTYSSFCHIFCGLGHPDMKIKFVLGGGAIEFGPIVFFAAIFINVSIFGLTLRSIIGKIQLVPEETPA